MYLIRETMHCKPGKVRDLVSKFKALSGILQRMGFKPFRLLTDVNGPPFWTVVAETAVQSLNDFFAMEDKVMADEGARQATAIPFHPLVPTPQRAARQGIRRLLNDLAGVGPAYRRTMVRGSN